MNFNPMKQLGTLTGLLLCLTITSCNTIKEKADLIIHNAKVYTMEEELPWASTVVIKENVIINVLEENESFENYKGKNTRLIDLQGKFVIPGFIDSHTHFAGYGSLQNNVDLMAVSEDEGLINELTCRVWMRLDLSRSGEIKEKGIKMNTHTITGEREHFLRYGAFKGYMDGLMGSFGALLFEPYTDNPETSGHYRSQSSSDPNGYKIPDLNKFYNMLKTATEAGFIANTHAIGDKGISLVLDQYEKIAKDFGDLAVARSRIIHTQTMREEFFNRFKNHDIIGEVNPSML